MKKYLLLASLVLASATNAFAYDLTGKFGLGLNGSLNIPVFGNGFNSAADLDVGYGIHGRYHFSDSLNLEVGYSRSRFDDTKMRFNNYNALVVWRTAGKANFTPVLGAGIGLTQVKRYSPSSLKLSALARAGVEYGFTSSLSGGIYADYQYVSKVLGDLPGTKGFHVINPSIGLTWYFGSASSFAKTESKKPVEKKQTTTSSFTDLTVADSDGDGVNDMDDKCPNTKAGVKVNALGCAIDEKARMDINVEFDSGKATVASKYNAHLKEVADFLKKHSTIRVTIEGHTDSSGNRGNNITLSQQRADAVVNALVNLGVEKHRLTAKGFGPAQPIADNSTAEGRKANRRVVAELTSEE